jgi:serine/threonine-protein kinase RsbT
MTELEALTAPDAEVCGHRIPIEGEPDISVARNVARALCQRMAARPVIVQRVSTMVSELARNIVSYTPGGDLVLDPIVEPPRRVVVIASDAGPGIPNLEHVLSGSYRSRTGMGMGLLGTKRLADRFDIRTGPAGTRVQAEVHL